MSCRGPKFEALEHAAQGMPAEPGHFGSAHEDEDADPVGALNRSPLDAGDWPVSRLPKRHRRRSTTHIGGAVRLAHERPIRKEASAKQKVARAELEFGYIGKPADQTKLQVAKAESAYSVAKEKCDDQAGNAKDVCVKEAKAVETKALADAKMGQQIGEAKVDAGEAKRDADYNVAVEKCDAMAADPKASCLSAAKLSFGKN